MLGFWVRVWFGFRVGVAVGLGFGCWTERSGAGRRAGVVGWVRFGVGVGVLDSGKGGCGTTFSLASIDEAGVEAEDSCWARASPSPSWGGLTELLILLFWIEGSIIFVSGPWGAGFFADFLSPSDWVVSWFNLFLLIMLVFLLLFLCFLLLSWLSAKAGAASIVRKPDRIGSF